MAQQPSSSLSSVLGSLVKFAFSMIVLFVVARAGWSAIESKVAASGGWEMMLDKLMSRVPVPGTWQLREATNDAGEHVARLEYLLAPGDKGSPMMIAIRCFRKSIDPAYGIDMVAYFQRQGLTITSFRHRRDDDTAAQTDTNYIIGMENTSRVLVQLKPVDSMTQQEFGNAFGVAGVFIFGKWLATGNGQDVEADIANVARSYYMPLFKTSSLLLGVTYRDDAGLHEVSRTVPFDNMGMLPRDFFRACALRNPL